MLTSSEIKKRYFGGLQSPDIRANIGNGSANLTASARFVAAEAKKRMGQELSVRAESDEIREADLLGLVQDVERSQGEELTERERTSVIAALSASLHHYDILTPLIAAEEVNDIIIRSYDDISIQLGRRNIQTDIRFSDRESYKAFVEKLLKRAGKACTLATPVVDAVPDPHVRVCVTHESFSPPGSGPMVTLRIARHQHTSLENLVSHELAPESILDYLACLVAEGVASILIAGEVGTGKTTLVRALASRISNEEAVLIIEDTHEIVLNRPFTRTLLTREANTEGAGRISPAFAVRTGMRMAMNRIILGEMRDAETAEAFVDVCASGHPGMSTIHARSARDAISRLELFLSRAQPGVTMDTVRRQIADAISVVVFLALDPDKKKRRVMEVLEVGSSSDGAVQLSPMFSFSSSRGSAPQWTRGAGVTNFWELLNSNGCSLAPPGSTVMLDPDSQYSRAHN